MPPRHAPRRLLGGLLLAALVGVLAPLAGPPIAVAADPVVADAVPVTGRACAAGEGVTVVVDAQQLGAGLELGCAPGTQSDGFAALAGAGFGVNEDPGALGGTVCQIDRVPAAGHPTCWNDGFWAYWRSDGSAPWSYSDVGPASGPVAAGRVEGWSWTSPIPADYSGTLPRLPVADLAAHTLGPADCAAAPQAPTFTIVDDAEVLPVTLADGHPVEVAVLAADADPATASWTEAAEVSLTGRRGPTRVLARRAGEACPEAPTFDATYDVRPAYAPRWNLTADGGPSPAVDTADPGIVGWATGHSEYTPGAGVSPGFQVPANAHGPVDSSLVVLGDRGTITLTFAGGITDGPGADLAVFENGFPVGAAANGLDFLELGYVEVSSDGAHFARFSSASRRTAPVGSFAGQSAAELGGLGGKDLSGRGTPFDLGLLAGRPEVRSGQVDLGRITHVRIVDIKGDGADLDSFGRPIRDPDPTTGSAGFDLTGVAVLNQPDALAPTATITGGPTGLVAARTAAVPFATTPASATVTCRVDEEAWTACTSPLVIDDLADGEHTVAVRAVRPGHPPAVASTTWTVDGTAPVVTVTAAPTGTIGSGSATIAFTVDDTATTVERRVDGGPWDAAASPLALSGLGAGDHSVELRATDAAGNVGTATARWTVLLAEPRPAAASWAMAAYADLLDREPTGAELDGTVERIQGGTTRSVIARELSRRDEWLGRVVDRLYLDTLGRPADAAGRAWWIERIRTGRVSVAGAAAAFHSSAEHYSGPGGGTPATWIAHLYDHLLHRAATADDIAYWSGRVTAVGRGVVARQVHGSLESRRDRVDALYETLLGRPADGSGRDHWADRLAREDDLALAVHLVASPEHAARAVLRFP